MRGVVGNRKNIFKGLGKIDYDKCIHSIFKRAGNITLNIDDVNKAADEGCIYVLPDGRILDTFRSSDEKAAKYMIVATGLTLDGTKYPLFASFIKLNINSKDTWQGAFIGTGEEIFKMYKEHYVYPQFFDNQYINVFCGPGVYMDIVGKGLTKVLKNNAPAKCVREGDISTKLNQLDIKLEQPDTKTKENNKKIDNKDTKLVASNEKTETKEMENSDEEFNLETIEKYDNSEDINPEQVAELYNAQFIKELYNQMIYKEKWMMCGSRKLDFYIKSLIKLLEERRKLNKDKIRGNGYLYSKDKRKCILNLGLINTYGNDIYILDASPSVSDFKCKQLSVVQGKIDLLDSGFTSEEIKDLPEAFSIADLYNECIFDAEFEDFDFLDTTRLYHVIEERRSRFPKEFEGTPNRILCDKIREAVRLAIKISKTDIRYVIPKYDFERKNIQFMIPFHINSELCDIPELVLIVGKIRDVWCIHTILDIDNAMADARLLFRPRSWLREG